MKRVWWSLVCVLALGVASACDDGGGGDDDAGMADSGGPGPTTPGVRVVTMRDSEGMPTEFAAADFSCIGMPTAPTGTGASTFTVTATDFFTGNPVEGLTIHFFSDNTPSLDGTCTGTCQTLTSDAMGEAMAMGQAGAWYAYRVVEGEGIHMGTPADYVGVVQVNEDTPEDGGETTLNVVSASTRSTILSLLGTTAEPDSAVVTGQVVDCMGRQVQNASVRVFDSSGEIELGFVSTGPRAFYFNGASFPSGRERATNTDGLYGAANVPLPADHTLRVELHGSLEDGGDPVLLGCEQVQVGDGITILNVGPVRADGPSGCTGS